MLFDFHTHSFFSDGELSPIELIRRAHVNGYTVIGVTDHASMSNLDLIIYNVVKDCALAEKYWGIKAIPGVELTHVPAGYIDQAAGYAKKSGIKLVVVHGETIVEPVEPGTNCAALMSTYVDVIAHPGFISPEECSLAAKNNIFLELSARGGHSLSNGHVAQVALAKNAKLLVNSDAHAPKDLLTFDFARKVASGAGISTAQINDVLIENPKLLLKRINC